MYQVNIVRTDCNKFTLYNCNFVELATRTIGMRHVKVYDLQTGKVKVVMNAGLKHISVEIGVSIACMY
jgi:hypothetical protein